MIYGNTVISDAASLHVLPEVNIREPRPTDAHEIWQLINETPVLDRNSLYCNLLQCSHFASTCAVGEMNGEIVGWLSGYVPPGQEDTLFVWQICVDPRARGQRLARRLIGEVLGRNPSSGVQYLHCTITESNTASWALFGSVSRSLEAQMSQVEHFLRDAHFGGSHDSELAVSIGPFKRRQVAALTA